METPGHLVRYGRRRLHKIQDTLPCGKKSIIYIRHCTNEPSSHSSGLQSTRIIGLPHRAGGDGGGFWGLLSGCGHSAKSIPVTKHPRTIIIM